MVLAGKVILITGGTGSLGKILARRILSGEKGVPKKVIILSRDEAKQHEMRVSYLSAKTPTDEVIYRNFRQTLEFRIGDVRNYADVCSAIRGVEIVINAAALKQVPSCEYFSDQAILTNCIGAMNLVRAIGERGESVKTVVGVSTDKACLPVNVMGMTKALQERIFISANILNPGTRFVCVRYGNVLASRGSVIPLFHDQILKGGPVTLTVPEMTRFLLSLDQAVDTVFAALEGARRGEIYVPNAPSATVLNIAKALIGERPIEIKVVGVRPAEKKHELMVSDLETDYSEKRGRFYAIRPMLPELQEAEPGAKALEKEFSSADNVLNLADTVELLRSHRLLIEQRDAGLKENFLLKVMTVLGTRPEIIKLSRVLFELDRSFEHVLVHTGQNFDPQLNEVFFRELGIRPPSFYLGAAGATPIETISAVLLAVDKLLASEKPDALLLYGDTNSCLCVIAAKKRQIPVFHMEAGNRCFDQRVPEELNRKIVDHLSDINMPLSEHARRYLVAEGIPPERVIKTGSPMREVLDFYGSKIEESQILNQLDLVEADYFVVSSHREENVDSPSKFGALLDTLEGVAKEYGKPIIVSTHPRTRKRLDEMGRTLHPNIQFLKPLGFFDYVKLQQKALCVLSDSGTLTEEASLLGFPAVMIRETHERPEGMDEASVVMSGLSLDRVLDAIKLAVRARSETRALRAVEDYSPSNVSLKVARIILSYVPYVNRTVWQKSSPADK